MEKFALAVIGSGSGNVVVPDDVGVGGKVAIIESGAFGGTCVNRGCIPTKMFAYTADLAMQVRGASRFGLERCSSGSTGQPSGTGSSLESTRPLSLDVRSVPSRRTVPC